MSTVADTGRGPAVDNPVKNPPDDPQQRHALLIACQTVGLDPADAKPLHRYNNTIYLLPRERAVARLTGSRMTPERVRNTQQVAAWVAAEHGVTATLPLEGIDPVTVDEVTVGFWTYYPQPDDGPVPTPAHLAHTLLPLHRVASVPFPLPSWTPLASLSAALTAPAAAAALADDDRAWLTAYVARVRTEVESLDWRLGTGLIHADAWAGNLLWHQAAGPGQVVLGDWDNVCLGPREVDLIPSWHAAIRYGRGRAWAAAFAEVYGYDLATWDGFDTLLRMRDLVQLTGPLRRAATQPTLAEALRQRFTAIRNGDRTSVWRAY